MGKAQVLRGATGASLPTTVPALSPEVALQRLKVLLRMRTTRPGLEFDRVVNAVVRTNEPRAISALAEHVRRRDAIVQDNDDEKAQSATGGLLVDDCTSVEDKQA